MAIRRVIKEIGATIWIRGSVTPAQQTLIICPADSNNNHTRKQKMEKNLMNEPQEKQAKQY